MTKKKLKLKEKQEKGTLWYYWFPTVITYNFMISDERAFIKTVTRVIKFKLTGLRLWLKIFLTTGQ